MRSVARIPAEVQAPTTRRKARILAFQVLYEIDGARHDAATAVDRRLTEEPIVPAGEEFARKLIAGVIENLAKIDQTMSTHAPAWPVSQISMVDRNILRVAIFEITIGGETPPKVAINEAIELGKAFGSDSSPKFVNAVLGSVLDDSKIEVDPT